MQIILVGKAKISTLQELQIISRDVPPTVKPVNYCATYFQTRTSSSERAILEILGFDESNITSYTLNDEYFTSQILDRIKEILEVSGEPDHINAIALLKAEGEFIAFVDLCA